MVTEPDHQPRYLIVARFAGDAGTLTIAAPTYTELARQMIRFAAVIQAIGDGEPTIRWEFR